VVQCRAHPESNRAIGPEAGSRPTLQVMRTVPHKVGLVTCSDDGAVRAERGDLQGYLAYKKSHPPRALQ